MIFFRFLVGIGLGIELVTIDTYLSEWVPTHLRNKSLCLCLLHPVPLGSGGGADVWMLVPTTLFGLSGWRWVIIFGALFSLAIWFIRKSYRSQPAGWKAKGGMMTRIR